MENYGVVTETRDKWALVRIQRHQMCSKCGACGSFTGDEKKEMEIEALNAVGAEKGQKVVIESQAKGMLLAGLILYIIPLLIFIGGVVVGVNVHFFSFFTANPELNGFLTGSLGMVAAYLVIRRWSRAKLQEDMRFKAVIREITPS